MQSFPGNVPRPFVLLQGHLWLCGNSKDRPSQTVPLHKVELSGGCAFYRRNKAEKGTKVKTDTIA